MQLIYTPEGAEPQRFDFRPGKLLSPEAEKIEELTGWSYMEFGEHLMKGSVKAYHALLFIFLRRQDPRISYDSVQFTFDEVDLDFDHDEQAQMIEELQRKRAEEGLDEDTERILNQLMAEQVGRVPVNEDPKEPTRFSQPDDATSGSSPTSST